MNIFQKISTKIRTAWFAGLGSSAGSREGSGSSAGEKNTTSTINSVIAEPEGIYEELLVKGASLESELSAKLELRKRLDRRISAINNVLGRINSISEDKLILMSDKVDQLTIVVNALMEKKLSEKKMPKKPRKSAVKKATKPAAEPSVEQISA